MTLSLQELVSQLEMRLPELERQRSSNAFANDVFEAVDDLLHLSRYVLEGNTRVNYPARVHQEQELWKLLGDLLQNRSLEDQQQYTTIFDAAKHILRFTETIQPVKDGHLGILKIIREQFEFLQTDYHFTIAKAGPIGIRFSSGKVYVELKWAKNYSSTCSFGSESNPGNSFWIDALLFMYGDQRYRTLPGELTFKTESDVESWFALLASIFKQYGHDMLSNRPGIFDKLAKAQKQRDLEYTQEMDRRFGNR